MLRLRHRLDKHSEALGGLGQDTKIRQDPSVWKERDGMCGIAGLIDLKRRSSSERLCASAGAMADALAHRGPDASGTWADPAHGVAFGHRRLSIVDLSEAGAQPMVSGCGRMVISYNGEVYNAAGLRAELEAAGRAFAGIPIPR